MNIYTVSKSIELDAGHSVYGHKGHCRNFHGHRWTVEAVLRATRLSMTGSSANGMVLDFGVLKQALITAVHSRFDHNMILCVEDPRVVGLLRHDPHHFQAVQQWRAEGSTDFLEVGEKHSLIGKFILVRDTPTAENLARLFHVLLADHLKGKISRYGIVMHSVTVKETPTSCAVYMED